MTNTETTKKSWYRTWWGAMFIVFGLIFLSLIMAFGFYVYKITTKIKSGEIIGEMVGYGKKEEIINADTGIGNYSLGTSTPIITIVEFSDFSCPFSKKSFFTIRFLTNKYKNFIRFVYRDYPIKSEYSFDLAMAGRCAGEQNLFWPMHDKLFQYQDINSTAQIEELANQIGADMTKFKDCFQNKKFSNLIQKDLIDGQNFDIKGTPGWFINGYKIEGDIPISAWEEIINNILKK